MYVVLFNSDPRKKQKSSLCYFLMHIIADSERRMDGHYLRLDNNAMSAISDTTHVFSRKYV